MTDTRRRWLTRGAGIVALLVVIWVVGAAANEVWMDLVDQSLIAAMGAVALDLVLGHTGMASIGNAAFMAVGALVTAELALYAHVPLLLACLGGGLGAALVGVFGDTSNAFGGSISQADQRAGRRGRFPDRFSGFRRRHFPRTAYAN